MDNAKDYLGSLSDAQHEVLLKFSRTLQRSDRVWLQARAQWLTELGVLLERKPGWQERVREAVTAQRENASPEYQRIYEHNITAISVVIAQLLDGRSERQDEYLRDRLSELREELQSLIAAGKEPAESAASNPAD